MNTRANARSWVSAGRQRSRGGGRRLVSSVWLAACLVPVALGAGAAGGQAAATNVPIRVACLDVYGTAEKGTGPKNLQRCLSPSSEFAFETVSAGAIRSNALARFDVLICPGGSGSRQAKTLEAEGCRAVEEFVRRGGGYIGICAGAYLASSHYPWSLGLLNAKVVDTAHWARGTGDVTLRITDDGRRILGAGGETVTCYYGQGPLLAPGDRTNLPAYRVLATYGSEIARKGAPSGVMTGTTAIAAASFGQGRVVCISPHPEKTKGLDGFIRCAVQWVAGRGANLHPTPRGP